MPYIKKDRRISVLTWDGPNNQGELNYLISTYINNYIERKRLTYNTINDIVGVLECCKLEVYRRIAANYEDKKIIENGDVFNKEFIE